MDILFSNTCMELNWKMEKHKVYHLIRNEKWMMTEWQYSFYMYI